MEAAHSSIYCFWQVGLLTWNDGETVTMLPKQVVPSCMCSLNFRATNSLRLAAKAFIELTGGLVCVWITDPAPNRVYST